ncbi:MAG: hypothetical protein B6242_15455 [Anaerolineaceae bacterium 4572_78]|nr:MAG: hypothetical protein B6242_15455 [Anaerolineaceae bacterium 4572_78]
MLSQTNSILLYYSINRLFKKVGILNVLLLCLVMPITEVAVAENAQWLADAQYTPPIATFHAHHTKGSVPLKVVLDASRSFDPNAEGMIEKYEWFVNGQTISIHETTTHLSIDELGIEVELESTYVTAIGERMTITFKEEGRYDIALTVIDNDGLTDTTAEKEIIVTNEEPDIRPTLTKHTRQRDRDARDSSDEQSTLSFKRGSFTLESNLESSLNDPQVAADSDELIEFEEKHHQLMQFDRSLTLEDINELQARGIKVLSAVSKYVYWVSLNHNIIASDASTLATSNVIIKAVGILPTQFKIAEAIDNNNFPDNARYDDGTVRVHVMIFDDISQTDAKQAIDSLLQGIQVLKWIGRDVLVVRTLPENIYDLAELDEIKWMEPAPPPNVVDNATSAAISNVDELQIAPYNLQGDGIHVGVWDGGKVFAHKDLSGRLTIGNNVNVHPHATHVAGTIGGSGAGNFNAKGMAPHVHIHSYHWDNDHTEMRDAKENGIIVISNHSYGIGIGYNGYPDTSWFGYYSTDSKEWDEIVFGTDLLVFKAAGNDRDDGPDECPGGERCDGPYDIISPIGVAKNIITVCATTDTDEMTDFSSWGPVDDGRVKPDLCANGESLTSTLPNNSYGSGSGTSMASPSAAGAAALLFEHFKNETSENPTAATMKALMIHGARDLGRPGPDYEFGWGLIDAKASADLIKRKAWRILGELSETGDYHSFKVAVSDTSSPLKATLVWTDPPGDPQSAEPDLKNDLDLVLISPKGENFFPWTLNKDNPTENAKRNKANRIDNVEQVLVDHPEAGIWTIEVKADRVDVAKREQAFTVVVTTPPIDTECGSNSPINWMPMPMDTIETDSIEETNPIESLVVEAIEPKPGEIPIDYYRNEETGDVWGDIPAWNLPQPNSADLPENMWEYGLRSIYLAKYACWDKEIRDWMPNNIANGVYYCTNPEDRQQTINYLRIVINKLEAEINSRTREKNTLPVRAEEIGPKSGEVPIDYCRNNDTGDVWGETPAWRLPPPNNGVLPYDDMWKYGLRSIYLAKYACWDKEIRDWMPNNIANGVYYCTNPEDRQQSINYLQLIVGKLEAEL